MSTYEIVIFVLLAIDVANVFMIAYIFKWARKAIAGFRTTTVEILSTDNPDSDKIITHLSGKITDAVVGQVTDAVKGNLLTLRRQIGGLVGLGAGSGESTQESQEIAPQVASGLAVKKAADALGIDSSYIPLLLKAYQGLKGSGQQASSSNSPDESW